MHTTKRTSERHGVTGLCEHFDVAGFADLAGSVAYWAAAVFTALEAHPAVEHLTASTAVCGAGLLLVQKGVDEEVDGPLVLTLQRLGHGLKKEKKLFIK